MSLCVTTQHQLADFALDVSFEAPRGITALFGASGTGKTSVKLSQLVPAKAHVEVATKMASTIEAGAQKQKMKMSMDMKVDMKPLK